MSGKYDGNDNYGLPKALYLEKIGAMDDEMLYLEAYSMMYHSARYASNHRADWHWMIDAVWDECVKRGAVNSIYVRAHKALMRDHRYAS